MSARGLSRREEKGKQYPRLDPNQTEDIRFLSYFPPPTGKSDSGQLEEWGDRVRFIVEDLHKLLQLSHEKFWCQAVFDGSLHNLVESYLKNAPRSHDMIPLSNLSEDFQEQHAELHKLVFMTCLRLATHKEDKEHSIAPSVFGEIIYENYIFDVPKLFDLCVLYAENGQILSKMIENIFNQQPKYNEDLSCAIPTIFHVLQEMRKKCGMPLPSSAGSESPKKTSLIGTEEITAETLSTPELQDLVFYLADIGRTLSSFLEVYPPASYIFHEEGFISQISEAYDLVPALLAVIKNREFETYTQKKLLRQKLAQAKKFLMLSVHLIITHCFLNPILENSGSADEHIEGFIQTLSGLLNERRFLADFESCHPFQDYADILTQCPCDVDEKRIQYIQEAFSSAFATYGKRKKPTGATTRGGRTSPDGSPGPMEEDISGGAVPSPAPPANNNSYDDMGACAPRKTGVELDSLIAAVKDLLPDLGEGFIELCLEEYGYDIEKVINSVLEDKLPPSLEDLDRSMVRQQYEQSEDVVISQRANIFDHDEFDVFSRDKVDLTKVYKGKKGKTDAVDLDKNDAAELNPKLAEKYGYQVIEVEDELYDDEYDDTYDTINVGADDADSADELTQRRQFTVPRVLQKKQDVESDSDESAEETVEENPVKDEFVPNPALIRQRAEERAQWKAQRRTQGQRSNFKGQQEDKEKKYDVKGEAKGKGQSDDVLKNRAWKEKHKSSRANHNRKYYSDKKRMGFGGPPK
ncbi:activating signal cointegrator 1 complex subunit 2-like [Saccostrea cucullata]|uniref:activating signal cointegrator 1 complex subunit 2-like n=1 Tax=Saccostrea cuccullata TaxID=36930 RepID=UPI002ED6ABA1